jgi:hypothetical protein
MTPCSVILIRRLRVQVDACAGMAITILQRAIGHPQEVGTAFPNIVPILTTSITIVTDTMTGLILLRLTMENCGNGYIYLFVICSLIQTAMFSLIYAHSSSAMGNCDIPAKGSVMR